MRTGGACGHGTGAGGRAHRPPGRGRPAGSSRRLMPRPPRRPTPRPPTAPTVAGLARDRGRRPAALAQLLGIGVAAAVATALSGESPVLPVVVALPGIALLALRDDRAELRRLRPSPPVAALAIAAAVPLVPYAVGQAHLQSASHDAHASLEHYFDMAWIPLAMPITAGVAALGIRGWRFAAGCAAVAAAIFGIAAILFPGQESSPGAGWGAVAIVWAVTLAAVTWLAEPAAEAAPAAA